MEYGFSLFKKKMVCTNELLFVVRREHQKDTCWREYALLLQFYGPTRAFQKQGEDLKPSYTQ